MIAGLLLDALLLLVVIFYAPLGAWRGGMREALLGGAILLGGATAGGLAPAWGGRLAEVAGLSETTSRFAVAIALMLVVGLGLGYAAGPVAGRRAPGLESRAAGAIIGALNALILLSFGLLFLNRFLHDGTPDPTVQAGWFAEALVTRHAWLLLLASVMLAGLIVAVRLTVRLDDDLIERAERGEEQHVIARRRRPVVAPPVDPDSGKVDPVLDPGGAFFPTRRLDGATMARTTRPVVSPPPTPRSQPLPVWPDPVDTGEADSSARRPAPATGGGGSAVDELLRRAAGFGEPPPPPHVRGDGGPGSGRERTTFLTDAALRNLVDPVRSRDSTQTPAGDLLVSLFTPVTPFAAEDSPANTTPATEGAARRHCRICGTPATEERATCAFCGADL